MIGLLRVGVGGLKGAISIVREENLKSCRETFIPNGSDREQKSKAYSQLVKPARPVRRAFKALNFLLLFVSRQKVMQTSLCRMAWVARVKLEKLTLPSAVKIRN
jgi:hypothetical protein